MKNDLVAGFSVFLLALPLCLGIAVASGCPPIAGVLTAIVGGMVGSLCGSVGLTIKGPAAGLIVIVLGAVQELGQGDAFLGYKLTLAVGCVAAVIQFAIALCKKAVFAEIMPSAVIHGMLAAIGVIIISKQAYVFSGLDAMPAKPLALLAAFPQAFMNMQPAVFAIGVFAFLLAKYWPKMGIPSTLVLLVAVIPLSLYFQLPAKYLINLPQNLLEGIQFPDFSQITSPTSIKYILLFAIVGSIESLLTVCAVDSIKGSASDLNQDLRATAVANLVSALLGGMPMISEIVRSKANIDYGAKTAKANFFHGLFLLVAVLFLAGVLNLIPLSSLAALLIIVGLRLASPHEFILAYKEGREQFLVFCTTFLVTLFSDLLLGVVSGLLLKVLLIWLKGHSLKSLLFPTFAIEHTEGGARLVVDGPLTFVSYLRFKHMIEKAAAGRKPVVISLHAVPYIDHTVLKKLQHLGRNLEFTIEDNQQLVRL